ncbi:MAG: 3-keto-5-aminohexanoate cleavage protein [Pseudomonadota bacterium]
MRDPCTIMVAPNGARRTKADHPNLPITESEIVDAVEAAWDAGAHAAHIHVRDEGGRHVLDARRYLSLISALRRRCGDALITQITTEAVDRYAPSQQRALVREVKPEAVSIALRELFSKSDEQHENYEFLQWAYEKHIAIQWIIYDQAELKLIAAMINAGVVPRDAQLLFVLGRYSVGQRSQASDLLPFLTAVQLLPALAATRWTVCAFGQGETECLATAVAFGGNARVGFENSILNADGSVAQSNAERVNAIVQLADGMGVPLATRNEARAKFLH